MSEREFYRFTEINKDCALEILIQPKHVVELPPFVQKANSFVSGCWDKHSNIGSKMLSGYAILVQVATGNMF